MRIRMQVKYTDYKVGRGRVTITELDEVKPETSQTENRQSTAARWSR